MARMRVAIVGAGASGLTAGRWLAAHGHEVTVYEKSRGYGGRAATRRTHDCVFDHGAQYLKLPDDAPAVRRLVLDELPREDLVDIGRPVWTFDRDDRVKPGDEAGHGEAKWTYAAGLTTLGKRLADVAGLTVRLETRVGRLERMGQGFRLYDTDSAALGEAERVLLAIPAPQALRLLRDSELGARGRTASDALARAPYHSMLSVMLGFSTPAEGTVFAGGSRDDPRPYYALVNTDRGHDISWLAIENDKGPTRTPAGVLAVLAQMAVPFSEAHYDDAAGELAVLVAPMVERLLGAAIGAPLWHDVARWRYARPAETLDPAEINRDHQGLLLVGDYVTAWRLHSALQAGLDVAPRVTSDEFGCRLIPPL